MLYVGIWSTIYIKVVVDSPKAQISRAPTWITASKTPLAMFPLPLQNVDVPRNYDILNEKIRQIKLVVVKLDKTEPPRQQKANV